MIAANQLSSSELVAAINWMYDSTGALVTRPGLEKITSTSLGKSIIKSAYVTINGTSYILLVDSEYYVHYLDGSDNPVQVGSLPLEGRPEILQFGGYAVFADGGYLKIWDGTTLRLAYDTGNLVQRNPEQAVHWFKKAATADIAGACLYLGMKYAFGAGINQNKNKAENTGNTELTNLQFSSTADSAYDVTFENKPTRLAPGDQATVTVKGKIPLNFDSGTRKIGTISVAANSKTVTSDLNMQAPSKLEIKKVRINCNEDTSTVRDGKTIDNVAPGSTCSLSITVSNTYDRNSGIDFEDIEIEADGDQEIDGDKETIDLDAGEEETITIDLEIDDDADKGEYDAFVRVEGQDSNSANHYAELEFKIKIEKPEHEIEIKSINLNPLSVDTCLVSEVTAEIRLYNNGENKEKNAGVEVRVPGLSFTKVIKDLVIDEGEDFVVKVPITIPKNAYPGKYNVIVTSLYEDVLPSKTSTAVFTILDECASQVTTLPPTTSNEENQEAEATETIKEKRTDLKNALFNMMLFFANIIVATTLVILGVKLYKDIKGMKK